MCAELSVSTELFSQRPKTSWHLTALDFYQKLCYHYKTVKYFKGKLDETHNEKPAGRTQ